MVLALALRLALPVLHGSECEHSPATASVEAPACPCGDHAGDRDPAPANRGVHVHAGFCAACELQLATPGAPLTARVAAPTSTAPRERARAAAPAARARRVAGVHRARAPPRRPASPESS